MWNWLSKAWSSGRHVLGKVKGGVDYGLRLFQKAKDIYGNLKSKFTNLPVVGGLAKEIISQGEDNLNKMAKERLGFNMGDVNKVASTARMVSNLLPSS